MMTDVICPYCQKPAEYRESSAGIYSRDYGPVWICDPCSAWVGCHPNGRPLGRLADARLRKEKQAAHAAFDPLWKRRMERDGLRKGHARAKGYKWLRQQLGLTAEECHIGMFDTDMCRRVVEVCAPYSGRLAR